MPLPLEVAAPVAAPDAAAAPWPPTIVDPVATPVATDEPVGALGGCSVL